MHVRYTCILFIITNVRWSRCNVPRVIIIIGWTAIVVIDCSAPLLLKIRINVSGFPGFDNIVIYSKARSSTSSTTTAAGGVFFFFWFHSRLASIYYYKRRVSTTKIIKFLHRGFLDNVQICIGFIRLLNII